MTEKAVGRSVGTVGLAVIIAAGLGYPILIVIARVLSPADAAVFLTFWGIVFGVGSALSPVEQEVSRQSALADVAGKRTPASAVQAVVIAACVVALVGLAIMLPGVSQRLFGSHGVLAVVALAAGVAFAVQFGVRGLLIGHHRVKSYGGLVVAEALARAVLLAAFVVAGLTGIVPLAVAVAAGSFAWLTFSRGAFALVDPRSGWEPWGPVVRRMVVLMLGAGLTASVLTGYPAVVKLLVTPGDEDRLGALFLALNVARLPLLLLSPVQAMAVPAVVRLSQDESGHRTLRALLIKGAFGAVGLAALGALLGALVGPFAVRLLFGAKYVVDPLAVGGLVWSSILLGAVMLLAAVLVARVQGNLVMLVWAVVAVLSGAVLLLWPGDTVTRAVLGLVIAPTVGLGLAFFLVLRGGGRPSGDHVGDAGNVIRGR
ncbi:MAG TPA: hypothetical protein VGP03_00760 [Pseudonocardiaceae bacterium]|nr:hypothetical protein [Pseudonocardiaceae bacterium]